MKARKIVILIIVGALGLSVTGTGIYFLIRFIQGQIQSVDYSKLKDYEFEDDNEALMIRYKNSQATDLSNEFNPNEMANIAIYKFKEHDFYYSKTYGQAKGMGVTQTIRASLIKHYDDYFMENISTSPFVKTAKRFYQSGNFIKTYNGENILEDKADWDESSLEELSLDEHYEKWGKVLSRPLIYIISSKTVLNTSSTEVSENGYTVHLDLSPEYSILRYVRQMTSISDIKNPIFESVHLDLTIDKTMNLTCMNVTENYSVVKIFKIDTSATINETYTYDEEIQIPDLKTNIDYPTK